METNGGIALADDFEDRKKLSFEQAEGAEPLPSQLRMREVSPRLRDAEHATIVKAFASLDATQFHGARAHLRSAASNLTAGEFADSVRESIHAVESVCLTLDPSAELSKALARLEQKISIHKAMRAGFASLYGYTSDEGGIRHALLEAGNAKV